MPKLMRAHLAFLPEQHFLSCELQDTKKALKKTKNEKQNGNKLEKLRLSLQVPFVEIETLSELTCRKNRKKVQLVKIFLPPEEHLKWV